MFLISFLILMGTAMMYSSTPADRTADDAHATTFETLTKVRVNAGNFLGTGIGWMALRPLLQLIELPSLADVFPCLLLATHVWPVLWPGSGAALYVAVLAFAVTLVVLAPQPGILLLRD